ncbi:MAG: thioredoxin family protein [Chromatiaceae bacterium]|jgi:thioredoxin 1|nr:thioredoxin family protein [Chromatiaceae bacterium]
MMTDLPQRRESWTLPALTQFDFHARIAIMPGTTLVMFGSPACGACRHLRRVFREVGRLEPAWQLFEVDAETEPGLTNEFEVFHLPTVFLFRDGEFHCELEAEARPLGIVAATHAAMQQPAREAP